MKIPENENSVENLIYRQYESQTELPRSHMGCSLIGHKCERFLWLNFRWVTIKKHPGRLLKLFKRGHNEETTVIRDLRNIGIDIRGTQTKVEFGKHVGGSLDGIIMTGLPFAPKSKAVLEIKTHSDKSFQDLKKNGVKASKFQHYIQMQSYMIGTKLDRALYYAVNKNDDEIYTEWVHLDKEIAERYVLRAQAIAMQESMPPPVSTDPSWYECKMCDYHKFCHDTKTVENISCRSCAHVTPLEDSTWKCERYNAVIPLDAQYKGCDAHAIHPELVPYEFKPGKDIWHAIYVINGKDVVNGESGFKSREIVANPSECAEPCETTKMFRDEMGGELC